MALFILLGFNTSRLTAIEEVLLQPEDPLAAVSTDYNRGACHMNK